MPEETTLAAQFLGVVGWIADDSSGYTLPDALKESQSGLYVTNLNELVSLSTIEHLVPENETLASWLTRITADVTTKVVSRVLGAQQTAPQKSLLSGTPLVNGIGRLSDTVSKQGRFVGFLLEFPRRVGVQTLLKKVGVQLAAKQVVPLPIYVYRSSSYEPVVQIPVSNTRPGWIEWAAYEVDLTPVEPNEQLLIGYYEDDLEGFAIQRSWHYTPCSCPNDPYPAHKDHATVRSVSIPSGSLQEDRGLPLLDYVQQESAAIGLNLELAVFCSAQAVLAMPQNRIALAEALQLALACRVLEGIISTPVITQTTLREDVQADAYALLTQYQARLYGGKDSSTQNTYYPSLLKQITLDTEGIDSVCLPKKQSWISVGTLSRGDGTRY